MLTPTNRHTLCLHQVQWRAQIYRCVHKNWWGHTLQETVQTVALVLCERCVCPVVTWHSGLDKVFSPFFHPSRQCFLLHTHTCTSLKSLLPDLSLHLHQSPSGAVRLYPIGQICCPQNMDRWHIEDSFLQSKQWCVLSISHILIQQWCTEVETTENKRICMQRSSTNMPTVITGC